MKKNANPKSSTDKFSTKLGAVAAAAGSAVGLGNVWRFPYIVGEDGGAVFLILYVIFTIAISIPIMMTEFAIGRKSGLPVTSAYRSLAPHSKWGVIGVLGVLTAFLISSYYNIVSGWTLYYAVSSMGGWLSGLSEVAVADYFSSLSADPFRCIIWMMLMLGATAAVVAQGVQGGIEKYSKILMPLLFLLIVVMVVRALFLPNGLDGISFFLKPDFSKLTTKTVFDALGQSFFSMSIGMGTMTTYGSYLRKSENIATTASHVAVVDFMVAFLSGAVIFPCVFAFGVNPSQGPGLVFVTLPNIFNQMPMGQLFASFFFLLLVVAAITSSVSLLEVVVAYLKESFKYGRRKATLVASLLCLFFGILCSLSQTIFSVFDNITANVLMPIGAFLIVLFAVHRLPKDEFRAEFEAHGVSFRLFNAFYFLVKYAVPIVILIIFANGILALLGISY